MNVKTILCWILAACLLFLSFGGGSAPAIILLIAAAVLVAPIQQLQEKLGPVGKKPLNIVVPVVLFLAALFISPNATPTTEPEPAATPVVTESPTATPEPTAEPTPEPTPEATEEPATEETEGASTESVASLIELSIKQGFDNYTVDTQGDTIVVNVWQDGIAMGAASAQYGDSSAQSAWETMKDSAVEMSNSFKELARTAGRDDITVVMNVINGQNQDNTLLTVIDGTVTYDCLDD